MSELKRHHINEVMDMYALTRGEPCYSQVYYADDVDRVFAELKARIHELENMPHTDNSAVIELLENENAQLKESRQAWIARAGVAEENLAKLEKELAELREATRWRKCSEELPPKDGSYMCAYKNKNKDDGVSFVDEAVWDGEKWSYKFDFWEDIIYWQFKPKAPEVK